MSTQVEQLGENRVRLLVDVSRDELEHAIEHATSDLAGSVRIPGFRKGKVPRQVLVARLGQERIFAEAVDSHIGGWFWNAAARSRLRPIAQPEYEYDLPATDKDAWRFSATVEVQPAPELVDWTTLEVPRPEADVPDELVERELEALRETVAELVPADERPAREGDALVVDVIGPEGEPQSDTVVELGAGRLPEEVEEALVGARVGEAKQVRYERADGSTAQVEVTVKHVNEKVLPPLDDELARAASEFDTLAELRAEIEGRLREQIEAELEAVFREAALDRLVVASEIRPSAALVQSRTRDLLGAFVRSLERRGLTLERYLGAAETTSEELVRRFTLEAAVSLSRELALEAVADRLQLEVSDDELRAFVREQAEAAGDDPEQVLADVWAQGPEELREDLRLRKALDRLAAEVKPIAPELAAAREKLWTPDKEKAEPEQKLWLPGSKESE